MSMGMRRNTLKRTKAPAFVKGRGKNRRKIKPIILSAWTAATSVYFGEFSQEQMQFCYISLKLS